MGAALRQASSNGVGVCPMVRAICPVVVEVSLYYLLGLPIEVLDARWPIPSWLDYLDLASCSLKQKLCLVDPIAFGLKCNVRSHPRYWLALLLEGNAATIEGGQFFATNARLGKEHQEELIPFPGEGNLWGAGINADVVFSLEAPCLA